MEYNELIAQARQAATDAPDTDAILGAMRCTLRRRQQRCQALLSAVLVLAVGASLLSVYQPAGRLASTTLAERVSARLDTPPTNLPAPLVGYRNSIYNHNIYTLR